MPRLLILSTTFYPDPKVAAVRVSEWAKSLPKFGWTPHIFCRHYGYDATEEQLAEAIHPDVRVTYLGQRQAKLPPGQSAPAVQRTGLRGYVRDWLEKTVVPDVSLISWRKLAGEAVAQAERLQPDVILSSSPTHSIHWLGRGLAQQTGAKWVADFRDPYLIDSRFRPRGWRKPLWHLHKRYEKSLYRDADLTIHAIPLHGRWAARAYPSARSRVRVLPNGAPFEQPKVAPPLKTTELKTTDPISLRAVGYLAPEAPALLSEAIQKLAAEGHNFDFHHAGDAPPTATNLPDTARERMQFLGRVPHAEALELVAGADLLIAYLSEERSQCLGLSSKLFEYLAAGKPIVVVNPTRPDRQFLRQIPCCVALTNPTAAELATTFLRLMEDHATSASSTLEKRAALAAKYNRRHQTEQLAGWLDELVN